MARFILSEGGLREVLRSREGPVGRDLLRRTLAVESTAKQLCPVNTGRLRSSIRHVVTGGPEGLLGVVGTDVVYAEYVHNGTRPHVIRPKGKKALYWKGADHPVRFVNHPGTKANPFLLKALEAAGR